MVANLFQNLTEFSMPDTQWPRYEVFKQEKVNRPYEAIGSVHAPDGEIALQNARDVHVRRPECHGLWVVPESSILKLTAEQIQREPALLRAKVDEQTAPQRFHLFARQSQRRSMITVTHVGEMDATSPAQALRHAIDSGDYTSKPVYVWWVVPENAIVRSNPEEILSLFEPATRKTYKQQSQYGGRLGLSRNAPKAQTTSK